MSFEIKTNSYLFTIANLTRIQGAVLKDTMKIIERLKHIV